MYRKRRNDRKKYLSSKKSLKDVYYKISQMTEFNLIEIYKDLFKHLDTFLIKMNMLYTMQATRTITVKMKDYFFILAAQELFMC
ncbi:MAG TPA: hypothetical protein DDY58_05545 [Terrisporobacter glycolicus]|uniref:hypothetical protein n=1 Tax=Terrisporobacter sp. TaxID=1965305 RepID=UPI000E895ACA|nr:hypothetical protein [Terrisporobacter sp.]HBI91929.1 hypothetical protein [Terrisporobacter hibernicus]